MRNRQSRVTRSGEAAIARMTDQDEPNITTNNVLYRPIHRIRRRIVHDVANPIRIGLRLDGS